VKRPALRKYLVLVPPIVQELIRSQALYIARDSVDRALAWERRLRTAINDLSALPTRYPLDRFASDRIGDSVRKMVFERTYLVFYRVREANRAVDILNLRHGAQLPRADEA
jgi:plasmid stabilization system protein ParE